MITNRETLKMRKNEIFKKSKILVATIYNVSKKKAPKYCIQQKHLITWQQTVASMIRLTNVKTNIAVER